VFEHVSDPGGILKTLEQVFQMTGLFSLACLTAPRKKSLKKRGPLSRFFQAAMPTQHINAFTNEFLELLAAKLDLSLCLESIF